MTGITSAAKPAIRAFHSLCAADSMCQLGKPVQTGNITEATRSARHLVWQAELKGLCSPSLTKHASVTYRILSRCRHEALVGSIGHLEHTCALISVQHGTSCDVLEAQLHINTAVSAPAHDRR